MRIVKRIIKIIVAVFAVLVVLDVATLTFFSLYHPKIQKADAVIILGAAINTPALYNRSLKGLELYRNGKADVLILSGGKIADEDISEAEYMHKVIKKNGGSDVPVILEAKSRNTFENIQYSHESDPQAKSVIIVSDRFHVARGVLLARRQGYHPVYWDSPAGTYYSAKEWVYYYFREGVAMLDYLPKFVFN